MQVKKSSPEKTGAVGEGETEETEANFSVDVSAKSPLQLTLTKTSLELLKSLAKAGPAKPLTTVATHTTFCSAHIDLLQLYIRTVVHTPKS